MQLTNGKLDAFQRTLGMTLCSLPFWLILSIYVFYDIKLPEQTQVWQTLIVAISSGVIATILFLSGKPLYGGLFFDGNFFFGFPFSGVSLFQINK